MCQRVECRKCGKPTYAGCGAHVEDVLGDVPPADRCHCREKAAPAGRDPRTGPGERKPWLRGLLGK